MGAEAHGFFVTPGSGTQDCEIRGRSESTSRTLKVAAPPAGSKGRVWVCRYCGEKLAISTTAAMKRIRSHAVLAPKQGCAQITEDALQELICYGVEEADAKLT